MMKYQPEDKAAKADRIAELAEKKAEGAAAEDSKAPAVVKFGLKHVTSTTRASKSPAVESKESHIFFVSFEGSLW